MKPQPAQKSLRANARKRSQRTNLMRALEPRVMFDAAAVNTAADTATSVAEAATPITDAGPREGTSHDALAAALQPAGSEHGARPGRELVFVDALVPSIQLLQSALRPGVEWVVLDPSSDGLVQIADHLERTGPADAIHILSHGQPGQLSLSGLHLNADTLAAHTDTLQRIGKQLSADGDILLYGCETGEGIAGQGLITELGSLTQADVAASTDRTGHSSLQGNWQLEASSGAIDHTLPFDTAALDAYTHSLPSTLRAGDIAVIGIISTDDDAGADLNTDGRPDARWAIVALTQIESGTVIHFTDAGFHSTGFYDNPANEGHLTWTTTSTVPVGTVLTMNTSSGQNQGDLNDATPGTGGLSDHGTLSGHLGGTTAGSQLFWSNLGDQLIVYQGTAGQVTNATFIYAFNNSQHTSVPAPGQWMNSGALAGQMQSHLPTGLTNGSTALALTSDISGSVAAGAFAAYGHDNYVYKGPTSGSRSHLLAAIGNADNWIGVSTATANQDFNIGKGTGFTWAGDFTVTPPSISNLNGDAVQLPDVAGQSVQMDVGNNATVSDPDLTPLNNWSGATLTVQRANGPPLPTDVFLIGASGGYTVNGTPASGTLRDAGNGQTFATYSHSPSSGVLQINFTSSGTPATTALVTSVVNALHYQNDTPYGDATLRFTLRTDTGVDTADVTVTSNRIFVDASADTATVDRSNGVSFREAVAIAAADVTGTQTLVMAANLDGQTIGSSAVSLSEAIHINTANVSSITLSMNIASSTQLNWETNSSGTATYSGVFSGTGGLAKSGAGTLLLSGANTFSGGAIIDAGTLSVGSANSLTDTGTVDIRTNGTLSLSGSERIGTLTGQGAIVLASGATLTVDQSATSTYSGSVSGAGSLAITAQFGNTPLTLSGSHTHTGGTSVSDTARVNVTNTATFHDALALSLNDTSTLTLGTNTKVGSVRSQTGTTLNIAAFNLEVGRSNTDTEMEGVLSGSGTITKVGTGQWTLSGNNTSSGAIEVQSGTLKLNHANGAGSGTIRLNGATATLELNTSNTVSNALTLLSAGTVHVAGPLSAHISGTVSGAGALTKTGTGTLKLSGTNFHASTTVSGGGLQVSAGSGLASGGLTLADDTSLIVDTAATITTAVALTGNASLQTDAATTLSGNISGTGKLTKSGTGTLTLTGTLSHVGDLSVTGGNLALNTAWTQGASHEASISVGATLTLNNVTHQLGAISGYGSIVNNVALTLGKDLGAHSFSGSISGNGTLTKVGTNTIRLEGSNTYLGLTTIQAGTLTLKHSSALTENNAISIDTNGSLSVEANVTTGPIQSQGAINFSIFSHTLTMKNETASAIGGTISGIGTLAKTGSGTLTLSQTGTPVTLQLDQGTVNFSDPDQLASNLTLGAATLTYTGSAAATLSSALSLTGSGGVSSSQNLTFTGSVTGAGTLRKTGTGELHLRSLGADPTGITVGGGSLHFNSTATTGNALITLEAGTKLSLDTVSITNAVKFEGNAEVSSTGITGISGNITGNGSLTKTGSGELSLGGTNSNTSTTVVSAGTLKVADASKLNAGSISLANETTLNFTSAAAFTLDRALSLAGTSTLSSSANLTLTGQVSGTGTLTKPGAYELQLSNTNNRSGWSGGLSTTGGTLSVTDWLVLPTGTLSLKDTTFSHQATGTLSNAISITGAVSFASSTVSTLSGVISGDGELNVEADPVGGFILQGSNTFTGKLTLTSGNLTVSHANALGGTTGQTFVTGGRLILDGGHTLAETIHLQGGNATTAALDVRNGASTLSNQLHLTANAHVKTNSNLTLSQGVGDNNLGYTLGQSGTAGLILNGTSVHSGGLDVAGASLTIGIGAQITTGSISLAQDTKLIANSNTTLSNNITLAGNNVVEAIESLVLSGVLSGLGGLEKAGSGSLKLSGVNTYQGATTVSLGMLVVNGQLLNTSSVTVNNLAGLTGTGTLFDTGSGKLVTVLSGGNLSAGDGGGGAVGKLTIHGNLNLVGSLVADIGGDDPGVTYDQVVVDALTLTSGVTLNTLISHQPTGTESYVLVDQQGPAAISGTLTGQAEGSEITSQSHFGTLSYLGGTGNDLSLTLVSVPRVTAVSANNSNGAYKVGSTIDIGVTFSRDVTLNAIGGTPTLLLETGSVDRLATYTSGSGSSTLRFSYVVQAGDLSADLDQFSATALQLNGATLLDSVNDRVADLTLATPGASGSLAHGKDIVVDGVAPSATLTLSQSALKAGDTATLNIAFDEDVTGLSLSNLVSAAGSFSTLSGSGSNYTAVFTPAAESELTGQTISLTTDGVLDAAGNQASAGATTSNFSVDTRRPTATVTVYETQFKAGETATVHFNFSEAVTGFDLSSVSAQGGALSNLTGSGDRYSATFTPTADITSAANVIQITGPSTVDAVGNAMTTQPSSTQFSIDTLRPSATITLGQQTLLAGQNTTVQFSFNESVTGFDASDVLVEGGTLSDFAGSGSSYTASFTPQQNFSSASNHISLVTSGYTDASGNQASGPQSSATYSVQTVRPTATLSVADTTLKAGTSTTVSIQFSEAVSGLGLEDLSAPLGQLSNLQGSGANYTATFTPHADLPSSQGSIGLRQDGVLSLHGNAGVGEASSSALTIDTRPPTATITTSLASLNSGSSALVTIQFSEAVSGFDLNSLTAEGGTLSQLAGDGTAYTASFTPTADISGGSHLIQVSGQSITDAAGNTLSVPSGATTITIDTLRPSASITLGRSTLLAGQSTTVQFEFSEPVAGFDANDVLVQGGSLSNFAGSGSSYTATFTPQQNFSSATNHISLVTSGFTDAAGNQAAGPQGSAPYAVQTVRPTATVGVANSTIKAGTSTTVSIQFSEAVTGLGLEDLSAPLGQLSNLQGSGANYTATFTPHADLPSSQGSIGLRQDGVLSLHGNAGLGEVSSAAITIDTRPPTATITTSTNTLTGGSSALVGIQFSEAVTGFDLADLEVSGGILSALQGSGAQYTAVFTPTPSLDAHSTSVRLINSGLTDLAGNSPTGEFRSGALSIDTRPPSAQITVGSNLLKAGDSTTVSIQFSEPVTDLGLSDLQTLGGTLSQLQGSGASYSATLTPSPNTSSGSFQVSLIDGAVRDQAGNASTGAVHSNTYQVDTVRPTVSLSLASPWLTADDNSIRLDVRFNEAVQGLTLSDFTVDHGVLSDLLSQDGGMNWQATLRPLGNANSTGNVIRLSTADVTDLAGNAGTQTASTTAYAVDMQRPEATIRLANNALLAGQSTELTLQFNEAVQQIEADAVTVANGQIGPWTRHDDGARWTATYTPALGIETSAAPIQLDLSRVRDLAGNRGDPSKVDAPLLSVDTSVPTVGRFAAIPALEATQTWREFEMVLSEPVSNLSLSNFSLVFEGNASAELNGLRQTAPNTYVVRIESTQGQGLLHLVFDASANVSTDAAGNRLVSEALRATQALSAPPHVPLFQPSPPEPTDAGRNPSAAPSTQMTPVIVRPDAPTVFTGAPAPSWTMPTGNLGTPLPLNEPPVPTPSVSFLQRGESRDATFSGPAFSAIPQAGNLVLNNDGAVKFQLPPGTFTHRDPTAQISFTARLSNGRPLPPWLRFDAETGTFEGTPPPGLVSQRLSIEVTGQDTSGRRVSTQVDVQIRPDPTKARSSQEGAPKRHAAALDLQHPAQSAQDPPIKDRPLDALLQLLLQLPSAKPAGSDLASSSAGRTGLSAQFDRHQQHAGELAQVLRSDTPAASAAPHAQAV